MNLQEAYRFCQQLTREQAKNFYYAFITLPPKKRRAIYAAYAFCRLSDDITDERRSLEDKRALLNQWSRRLQETYQGHPTGPVFIVLRDILLSFPIPQEYFQEVIKGVAMDLYQRRYQNFEELRTYCYRVASAVGLICLEIFGYRDPRAKDYAVDLGLAMQLTNILRDIQEDAQRGRIYIPQDEMERFGYSEAELLAGVVNDPFRRLMRFQVQRARSYFDSGRRLLPLLSPRVRACPAILHGIYSEILKQIERVGYNVFNGRITLSTRKKLSLMVILWARSFILPG